LYKRLKARTYAAAAETRMMSHIFDSNLNIKFRMHLLQKVAISEVLPFTTSKGCLLLYVHCKPISLYCNNNKL